MLVIVDVLSILGLVYFVAWCGCAAWEWTLHILKV
jgi:hypothetical protein